MNFDLPKVVSLSSSSKFSLVSINFMFCPKCSQPQLSDDVRFCSRCGFPLHVVSELLSNDGSLVANQMETMERAPLIRRKGVRIGAKIIFLSVFLALPAFVVALAVDSPLPLMIAVIPFIIGLAQILYTYIFGESIIPIKREEQPLELSARKTLFSFPASQGANIPINNSHPLNTAEFKQPPSVTEDTTKLLKQEIEKLS